MSTSLKTVRSCFSLVLLFALFFGQPLQADEGGVGQTENGVQLIGIPPVSLSSPDRSDRFDVAKPSPRPGTKTDLLSLQVGCVRGERPDGSAVEGSGFVIASEYFLTSAHGIRQTERLRVRFQDGGNDAAHSATLLSVSPVLDLALLHLPRWEAPPLPFPRSTGNRVGETVVAVGCPLGRAVETSTGETDPSGMDGLIQSRLVVQPGNSGGPLLNQGGEVLGMILWTGKDRPGEAFALPVREIKRFLGESFFQMGGLLTEVGRYADAAEVLSHGTHFAPESAKVHNNLGEAFRMMREGKRAEGALQQSIALNPDYAEAHYNLGLLYKTLLDHPTKAAIHFRRYLYLRPTAPESGQIGRWLTALSAASSDAGGSSGSHGAE
jgi:S1-C subfamily serine protease